MACFIPQNIAMQKKKNRKFWTWRYSFLIDRIRAGFSAVGLFLGRKSKISHEQNVKEFQFYIRVPNFQASRFNNKKKYMKVADPLKKSRLLFFGCFDLESGRIKLSRPWWQEKSAFRAAWRVWRLMKIRWVLHDRQLCLICVSRFLQEKKQRVVHWMFVRWNAESIR